MRPQRSILTFAHITQCNSFHSLAHGKCGPLYYHHKHDILNMYSILIVKTNQLDSISFRRRMRSPTSRVSSKISTKHKGAVNPRNKIWGRGLFCFFVFCLGGHTLQSSELLLSYYLVATLSGAWGDPVVLNTFYIQSIHCNPWSH